MDFYLRNLVVNNKIEKLKEYGIDNDTISLLDSMQRNLFHYIEQFDTFKYLYNVFKENINHIIKQDKYGMIPFHFYIEKNCMKIVNYLLKENIDKPTIFLIKDNNEKGLLHYSQSIEMSSLLLKYYNSNDLNIYHQLKGDGSMVFHCCIINKNLSLFISFVKCK